MSLSKLILKSKNAAASSTPRTALTTLSIAATLVTLTSCAPEQSGQLTSSPTLFAAKPYNFRLSLTDAPNDAIKSVFVNVKRAELHLTNGQKDARVIVANNLGLIDLLTLRNGVTLPMADLDIPEGVAVRQIRLVLEGSDNHLIKSDGSRCELKTPSGQQSGIKMIMQNAVVIDPGYSYSIVADFDALKSVVLKGNGGCLLKPVLKLKSATRISPPVDEKDVSKPEDVSGSTPTDGSTTTDGSGATDGSTPGDGTTSDGSGWDDTPAPTYPDIEPDELAEYF